MANTIGLKDPGQIKAENDKTVYFDLGHPNPLLLKPRSTSTTRSTTSKKCKEVATSDDPWAKKFLENNTAGFGPYKVDQLVRGQQAVYKARDDYWGGKPKIDTVIFKEVPTSANRVQLLQGGAVDIAQYLQPLETHQPEEGRRRRGRDHPGDLHAVDRAQRQDRALRQDRRAPGDELRLPAGAGDEDRVPGPGEPARRLPAGHLSRLRRQVFRFRQAGSRQGEGAAEGRPASATASRPSSPTMPATRCRSRRRSCSSRRSRRSASSWRSGRCRRRPSTTSSPSASSR